MNEHSDRKRPEIEPNKAPDGARQQVRLERLKIRTLKKLRGGDGAADATAGSVSNDCSCSCPG
jgi:hypothetical protein